MENAETQCTGSENPENVVIPCFEDISSFSQKTLMALVAATKASNDLPSAGDDFDYYSSFDTFRNVMDLEGKRLLELMHKILRYHGTKGSILSAERATIDDKLDVLLDANDVILERTAAFMDEAIGIKKQDTSLVVASVSTPRSQLSGSWNKQTTPASDSKQKLRLLSAKNIQRPQANFKDKIDNSERAFVPKIATKHHATKPLQDRIVMANSDAVQCVQEASSNESFPHPYQYELSVFSPPAAQLVIQPPMPAVEKTVENLVMVDKLEDLEKLLDVLKKQKEFAVDLEAHTYRTYQGICCLMQISTLDVDYIVDVLVLRSEMHILNEVFADPKILKVLHGAEHDVLWLQRDFGIYIVNLFDTGQASRVLNMPRFSLAALLLHYCDVNADKQFQLADWRIRPLPEELVEYARTDTHYLLYIHARMRNELLEKGNDQKNLLRSVYQRSAAICATRYEKPKFSFESHLGLYRKSRKIFTSRQLYALRRLYEWRDQTARTEDESLGYVLPNHMLLQVAEVLPREAAGVLACCNPIPPLVRQNVSDIHALVQKARELPLEKLDGRLTVRGPSMKDHPKYNVKDLLCCPHDTTPKLNSPVALSEPKVVIRAKASPTMFANNNNLQLHELFSTQMTVAQGQASARAKAAQIRASFQNPFEQYMSKEVLERVKARIPVQHTPTRERSLSTLSDSSTPASTPVQWRLRPNTVTSSPASTSSASLTSTPMTRDTNSTSLGNSNGEPPLHEFVLKSERLSPVETLNQQKRKSHKRKTEETTRVDEVKEKKKKKEVKKEESSECRDDEPVEDDFRPFDYSAAVENMEQDLQNSDKKKKNKKLFDPNRGAGNFKAPKPKHKSALGNKKSFTYTKHSSQKQPKR